MNTEQDVLSAERHFFTSLLEGDEAGLDRIVGDDFVLIDVMSGSEIPKSTLLSVIAPGQLKFEAIDLIESRVRFYGTTAVVTGRTQMSGRFGETPFTARSRYTHVYAVQEGRWRLVSAQGTQITGE